MEDFTPEAIDGDGCCVPNAPAPTAALEARGGNMTGIVSGQVDVEVDNSRIKTRTVYRRITVPSVEELEEYLKRTARSWEENDYIIIDAPKAKDLGPYYLLTMTVGWYR